MGLHPKFTSFIEKLSVSQQDITDSLQRMFSDTGLARAEHQGTSKKINDPTNAEHCIIVGNTQGKNPLTYIEYNPQTYERIIRQVGMLPRQRQRSLIKNTLMGEEKVGQPIITQNRHEIVNFLNELHEQVDLRSQHTSSDFQELDYAPSSKRKIDIALLETLLNEQAPDHVSPANNDEPTTEDSNLLQQIPPTRFENLLAYTAHVEQTPAHPAIDIRLLIMQGHPALTEASLTEIEIHALQVASNMLYQEVALASDKPQILPPLQKLISLFNQDKARNHVIGVFLSVFVEKINELSAVETK